MIVITWLYAHFDGKKGLKALQGCSDRIPLAHIVSTQDRPAFAQDKNNVMRLFHIAPFCRHRPINPCVPSNYAIIVDSIFLTSACDISLAGTKSEFTITI